MKGTLNFNKSFVILILTSFTLLFLAGQAEAGTWEYVTHGGYDAAVEAWKRVALIFSSSNYMGLLTIAAVLGFFIAFVSFLLKTAFGIRTTSYTWLSFLAASAIVYGAFILPKDRIVIYDETLNRGPYEVDGVPVLIATLAGTVNEAERALIELIATSSDPVEDYRYNPAGIAFNAFGSVRARQIPSYIYQSLYGFFKDCIMPTAAMGTSYTIEDLASGRVLLKDAITGAANPSLYTVIYDSNGKDLVLSCKDAAAIVSNYINTEDNFRQAIRAGCARAGYNPDSTASYQACKDMMSRSVGFLLEKAGLTAPGSLLIPLQQLLFADIAQDYILAHGPEAVAAYLATQKTTGSFIGLGIHANSWIPELREALTATAISLTPLLLLFLVTPLGGRAISVIAGMFIWLGMWGVIDAVITSFGMSMAADVSKYLPAGSASDGLGLFAASILPNATTKIYAIFGALRWSGLMLASVISAMLVRFGGAALAMLAGQIASQSMGSGAAVGSAMSSEPVQTVSNLIVPAQAWANAAAAEGIRNLMKGMSSMQQGKLMGDAAFGRTFSAGQIAELTQTSHAGAIRSFEKFKQAFMSSSFAGHGKEGLELMYKETGGDAGKLMEAQAGIRALQELGLMTRGGSLLSQIAEYEKFRSTGMMSVQPLKDGTYAVNLHLGEGGKMTLLYGEDGELKTVDVKYPQGFVIRQDEVNAVKESYALKHADEIAKEARMIQQGSFNTRIGKDFKAEYTRAQEELLEKKLAEEVKRNKELQDYLDRSNMSIHELATRLVDLKIPIIGTGGEIKYGAQLRSKSGIRLNRSLAAALSNAYTEASKEALKVASSELETKGYSKEDIHRFLTGIGAKHADTYLRMEEASHTSSAGFYRELNTQFLNYYAEKQRLNPYEALVDIGYKLSENPDQLSSEVKEFLTSRFERGDLIKEGEKIKEQAGSIFSTTGEKIAGISSKVKSSHPTAKDLIDKSSFSRTREEYEKVSSHIDSNRDFYHWLHLGSYIPFVGGIGGELVDTGLKIFGKRPNDLTDVKIEAPQKEGKIVFKKE